MKPEFQHDVDHTDIFYPEKETDCRFTGVFSDMLDLIMKNQLMRADLWRKFVNLYRLQPDAQKGWSGEYWGKMMRGACWVYAYSHDEALYRLLRDSVQDLIGCAEPCGRISTYAQTLEFRGWDMWCRKYVLLGLEYFYEICPERELREQIKETMIRHLHARGGRMGTDPDRQNFQLLAGGEFFLHSRTGHEVVETDRQERVSPVCRLYRGCRCLLRGEQPV